MYRSPDATMQNLARYAFLLVGIVIIAMLAGLLGACGKQPADAPAPATATATVPPPPGDSTPKAIDSNASTAMPANEKTGNPGGSAQSTTGSASSGAPPYSMQAGPEGNPSTRGPLPGESTSPNTSNPPSTAPNGPAPNTTSTEPNK